MRYLARFLNASDTSASLRHAAYALVVGFSCGWLTWDMIRGPITSEWNFAFGLLLGAVTTGKIVGAAAPSAPDAVRDVPEKRIGQHGQGQP